MNILYADLEPEWRGGQNQALLTLRGLRARGHSAELLAARGCPLARRALAEGIPAHTVGRCASRFRAALLLRRLLAQGRFDVLHVNEPHALTSAWLAGGHRRVPVVVSRRVGFPLQKNAVALGRYRSARRILAISHYVAKNVSASALTPDRVEVVYEGIEIPPLPSPDARHQARQRWGLDGGETLLGCVGYLVPGKGQEFLIRALPALNAQGHTCRLLLAGDGPCRADLERLARAMKVESAVLFAGFVDELSQVYAALDVFLFPSLFDALGTSLLAAMAYSLPVVALARGGVPEIIEDGRSGLLVSDADPAGIAAAVARLLQDAGLAKRLGSAARETVLQRFSADTMVERTLRIYKELCSPRTGP